MAVNKQQLIELINLLPDESYQSALDYLSFLINRYSGQKNSSIEDILAATGTLSLERAKELQNEIKTSREEWDK